MFDAASFVRLLDKSAPVEVYTDGACSGNPGPGGWGVYCEQNGITFELGGGSKSTTNQRMELMAAIEGISIFPPGFRINLYTDSKYVYNGITDWVNGWKRKNWRKKDGSPVLNLELWQKLDSANQKASVNWSWVKGHSTNYGNQNADRIAVEHIPKGNEFPESFRERSEKQSKILHEPPPMAQMQRDEPVMRDYSTSMQKEPNSDGLNKKDKESMTQFLKILNGLADEKERLKWVIQLVLFDKEYPEYNALSTVRKLIPDINPVLQM